MTLGYSQWASDRSHSRVNKMAVEDPFTDHFTTQANPRRAGGHQTRRGTHRTRFPRRNMRSEGSFGRFGTGKRLKSQPTASMLTTENMITMNSAGMAWMRLNTVNRADAFRAMAQAIWIKILNQFKSPPSNHNSTPLCWDCATTTVDADMRDVYFTFKQDSYYSTPTVGVVGGLTRTLRMTTDHTAVAAANLTVIIRDSPFSSGVDYLAAELSHQAFNSFVLDDIAVYRSDMREVYGAVSKQFAFRQRELMGSTVTFKAKSVCKFQNVSEPGGSGTTNLNDIGAVALSGRFYDCANPTPRVRSDFAAGYTQSGYQDPDAGPPANIPAISSIQFWDGEAFNALPEFRDSTTPTQQTALRAQFSEPLRYPQSIFDNMTSNGPIIMKPGGFRELVRTYTHSGTLRQLCLGLYGGLAGHNLLSPGANTIAPRASSGTCTLVCLKSAIRNVAFDEEDIKLVLNQTHLYSFDYTPKKRKKLPVRAERNADVAV